MSKKEIAVSEELHKKLVDRERQIRKSHSKLYYPFFKRMADICCSIAALIVMVVLLPFVMIAIKIDSKGPIFFSQLRVGQYGELIKIYKFRTMCVDAEQLIDKNVFKNKDNPFLQHENDVRVTKVGAFLRKFSIDELPQFFNVLKGDMSIVGTRPPLIDEVAQYELHHRARLAIKPGITGLWQVSGRSNITDFEEVVALDTQYISEWNIGLDIRILLKTVMVVLKEDGSM